jgi:hypothetical protein
MHLPGKTLQDNTRALGFMATLPPIWLLMHGYQGLIGDAQLYAFQAVARIHPQLATDLYLQDTSQDQFTIFSPFYAFFITHLGLEGAARLLTVIFTAWLYAAAWSLARPFTDRATAFLVVGFLMTISGDYGASGVFQIFEHYLTARLPAEAMIISALVCHFRGARLLALSLAIAALFVHPLIALPGCLVLICVRLPIRVGVATVVASLLTACALAAAATNLPAVAHVITIMDEDWVGVVRERSQFLLPRLWSLHDWSTNAQPFVSLLLTYLITRDSVTRKLCASVMLIGAAGLTLALIGDLVGPITVLLQGQPWRWVWIVVFVGALLVPATVLKAWRDHPCGPICGTLMVCSWSIAAVDGTACASMAVLIWLTRRYITAYFSYLVKWATYLLAAAVLAWISVHIWKIVISVPTASTIFTILHDISELRITTILIAGMIWWKIRKRRTLWQLASWLIVLLLAGALLLPYSLHEQRTFESAANIQEFSDWTSVIPSTATVLIAPPRDAGAFVWFTLQRPNYLSLDQSAGVVFSRSTSLEIQRRSQVLRPLMDPDWKILTRIRAAHAGTPKLDANRPLTADILVQVCKDRELGFVISQQKIGFHPTTHEHDGRWKNWNLYDCRDTRRGSAAT